MISAAEKLLKDIENRGWKGQIVPVNHLTDLREAILGAHAQGLFSEEFYREELTQFSFENPEALPGAKSIIVIAFPVPLHRTIFHWQGKRWPLRIPPTYVNYTATTEVVRTTLAVLLERDGYGVAKTKLPLKTLAVRSGLAEWGRNNICFVPGMGSFLQLVASFSDLPCLEDPWREPQLMERCDSCVACMRKCPTGAITRERVLLHAERCLTFHNERDVEIAFPPWIDSAWHNALVGCMNCQSICPENKAVKTWIEEIGEFSAEETALLMERTPFSQLPAEMLAKLRTLGINELQALPRNLAAILNRG
ncbi:MAG: epoxyqueuosine reductase [Deltaproteobacteria bacterium]|nr:MAG: epoxyqueuosine reductase [Deltaproteobacteria bacterium]